MKEITFDTGLVTYSINGKIEVTFNPTDSSFVEKLFSAFEELDKKQEKYKADVGKVNADKEVFCIARDMDKEMRDTINDVFGIDICSPVFGYMNVYAIADGFPVWANLLLAIMEEIDTSFAREKKQNDARILKYTSKYHR